MLQLKHDFYIKYVKGSCCDAITANTVLSLIICQHQLLMEKLTSLSTFILPLKLQGKIWLTLNCLKQSVILLETEPH